MSNAVLKQIAELKKTVYSKQEAKNVSDSLDVLQHIAPVYHSLHDDIQNAAHQYYNLPGGRGSGKSSFCALEIVSGIMQDPNGESSAIIFRRYANTLRESVYSQIAWAIDMLNVGEYWRGNVSPMSWIYKPTGAQIIFRGLDDNTKLKSIKPRHGYFKYIWFEEFNELPGENFTRSVLQSVQRGKSQFVIFRSFNPPISINNWANMFIQIPDERAITLHTSYLDIPAGWIGEDFILEAERLKEINEQAYRHEYLGEAIGSGGEVFPNIISRKIEDSEINALQYIYCGVDFGFSVDPACFIRVAYDQKYDTIYLIDEIYKKRCSNHELAKEIKAKGYHLPVPGTGYRSPWGFGAVEDRQLIVCDSSEPKSINDLREAGLKVKGCRKFPGCVKYRVKWLQCRHIVIDPQRTPNAHREFTCYEYVADRDGVFTGDLPDRDNHSIDAVAYALDRIIYKGEYPA